jgi:hypothetical protein
MPDSLLIDILEAILTDPEAASAPDGMMAHPANVQGQLTGYGTMICP